MGYFYRKFGSDSGAMGIFPGSSTFETKRMYLVGIPVDHKGAKYLENIIMISPEELALWLPEVAPAMVRQETADPRYDATKDTCVCTVRVFFGKKQIGEDKVVETPERADAGKVFAAWLAAQIG